MANHKSAEKRARQNIVRRARNRSYITSVRTAVKTLRAAISGQKDQETLSKLFQTAQSLLTKAAKKGIIHKNNASRSVGRLSKAIKLVQTPGAKTVATKKPAASKAKAKTQKKTASAAKSKAKKKTSKKK